MTYALRGATFWAGGPAAPERDGALVVGEDGRVVAYGTGLDLPPDVTSGGWLGPALYDAHVHLAFGSYDAMRASGVVTVRDLGAPPEEAQRWRGPNVAVAGPLLTAPGGYPSRSWGANGFARFVSSPAEASAAVRGLDVDVVKVALEPSGGAPVLDLETVRAIVDAAHDRGLPATAHALTEPMVVRALDAGIDELCHTPVEPLSEQTVERILSSGVTVVSTIETLGRGAVRNAGRLVGAGVPMRYGTDLGNAGTFPGADQRELDRLADAGLGPLGALRAATMPFAIGERARAVLLDRDPVEHGWSAPRLVVG